MKRAVNTEPLKARFANWVAMGGSIAKFYQDNPETSERTYRRWAAEPGFQAEVQRQSSLLIENIRRRLTGSALRAQETLYKLLSNANPAIQLGAAKAILDRLLDVHDVADFDRRLAELQERADRAEKRR